VTGEKKKRRETKGEVQPKVKPKGRTMERVGGGTENTFGIKRKKRTIQIKKRTERIWDLILHGKGWGVAVI